MRVSGASTTFVPCIRKTHQGALSSPKTLAQTIAIAQHVSTHGVQSGQVLVNDTREF